jgi:putative transposase
MPAATDPLPLKQLKEGTAVIQDPPLPLEVQQRVRVIERLMLVEGTAAYGKEQQSCAQELGMSLRSLQRLVKRWRASGVVGVTKQVRSDRGVPRITPAWQDFILKTYREGNQGQRRLSRAQVAERVKARAEALGMEDYPSRMTVYRLLEPQIKQTQRPVGSPCERETSLKRTQGRRFQSLGQIKCGKWITPQSKSCWLIKLARF